MKRIFVIALVVARAAVASAAEKPEPFLKPSAELRLRMERRNNIDYSPRAYDLQYGASFRARVGLLATSAKNIELFVQPQYTDYFGGFPLKADDPTFKTTLSGGNVPGMGLFEMHQANVAFKNVGKTPVGIKIGRQELNYGDQRLMGSFDYSMFPRHFDAAKATFAQGLVNVDVFAARAFMGPVTRTTGFTKNVTNDADKGRDVYGAYAQVTPLEGVAIDAYELILRDGAKGMFGLEDPQAKPDKAVIYTTGTRLRLTMLKGLEAVGELAVQNGRRYNVAHSAYAWAAKATYRAPLPLTPLAGLESIFATGDRDPKDGKSGEFENLFPTNHFKYGAIDQFGWRNIRAQHATLGLEPRKNFGFYVDGWTFALPETGGPWKNAGGGVVRKAAPGKAESHDAGRELDFTARYVLHEKVTFFGHYGKFFAGDLLKDAPGRHTAADFVMLQVQTTL